MRGRRLSMLRVVAPEPLAEDAEDDADGEKPAAPEKE